MRRTRVIVSLPQTEYARLVELADQEERAADQQATLLLKRLLQPEPPQERHPINGDPVAA